MPKKERAYTIKLPSALLEHEIYMRAGLSQMVCPRSCLVLQYSTFTVYTSVLARCVYSQGPQIEGDTSRVSKGGPGVPNAAFNRVGEDSSRVLLF